MDYYFSMNDCRLYSSKEHDFKLNNLEQTVLTNGINMRFLCGIYNKMTCSTSPLFVKYQCVRERELTMYVYI